MRPVDPQKLIADVGRKIAELRIKRGLTQEQFAVELGASFQYVSRVESGQNLTLYSISRIANILKVSVIELFIPPEAHQRPGRGRPRKAKNTSKT